MNRGLVLLMGIMLVAPAAFAHDVTVDGDPSDWTFPLAPFDNLGMLSRDAADNAEYVWRDAAGDERTDFGNSTNEDLLQFRVTVGTSMVYFLVELNGVVTPSGDGAPQVQIAIDLDHQMGSGQQWLGSNCDTQVAAEAAWEYLVVTRFGSGQPPAVFDPSFNDIGAGSTAAVLSGNVIEIGVDTSLFGSTPTGPVYTTVAVVRSNASDDAWDVAGASDVMDAITNYGTVGSVQNTWADVSDGVLDYNFALWFHLSNTGDPSPPLVVNEFLADAVSEPQGEWIELYNRTGTDLSLDGYKVGDEETLGGGEGMEAFPAGSTVAADGVVVVARSGAQFSTAYGFLPDFEIDDTSGAADMVPFTDWATGSVSLGNSGDEIILLDPHDTVIDVVTYGSGSWVGVTAASAVQEGHSLERPQPRPDTDDCSVDFVERSTPSPGAVYSLLGLGQPCISWIECSSDFCADGVCCESACDGTCDQCDSAGVCQPVTCPPPANECQLASCDPVTGCFAASGTACDDGDACTQGETCDGAGNCTGGSAVTCPAPSNSCQLATCDPVTGCFAAQGTPCDDGSACTVGDSCDGAGNCAGTMDCDDSDPCTVDSCNPLSNTCVHAPYVCNDNNPCTDDICDGTGGCDFVPNTFPCDDGEQCTHSDVCQGGVCRGVPYSCNDSNSCTIDVCNGDGTCTNTPVVDGTACDDGNPCTDDSCDSVMGCQHSFNTNPCDDGNACTENDTCSNGTCSGQLLDADDDGFAAATCGGPDCDDQDAGVNPGQFEGPMGSILCSDGIDNDCDGQTDGADPGCLQCTSDAACDDGNLCNGTETCQAGSCQPGQAPSCDDGNPCTDDSCDPETGCQHAFNTAPCDDGDACTSGDTCSGGVCVGAAVDCDDGDPCTDDSCDSALGCQHTNNTASCDDGDPCTENDACNEGACQGTPKDCSGLDGECGVGVCDEQSGECVEVPVADGTACDDGNPCTTQDVCTSGQCGGTPIDCSSLDDQCNRGECNQETGQCRKEPLPNGTSCDDGDPCTAVDSCQGGVCRGGFEVPDCGETSGGSGCSCSSGNGSVRQGWLALLSLLVIARRKRRSTCR